MDVALPAEPSLTPAGSPMTAAILFYGDFPGLAERLLRTLTLSSSAKDLRFRFGLNAVSKATRKVLDGFLPLLEPEMVIDSPVNLYKAGMMRHLFYDRPIGTPWTIWFDDDSYVRRCDWLQMLVLHSERRPTVDMWGQKMSIRLWPELELFLKNSPWYRGREWLQGENGNARVMFIAGGYWAIRTSWLQRLNWPDARLLHFGDDYLLGEAIRQSRGELGNCASGVAVNSELRRAPINTPSCVVLH